MNECKTCRFFSDLEYGRGGCHRYPPTVHDEEECRTYFPTVEDEYWCGEWSAKEEEPTT
jgi:hypothetical protein